MQQTEMVRYLVSMSIEERESNQCNGIEVSEIWYGK